MPITLVNPMNEQTATGRRPAPRLASLAGARVLLLDISKPGGNILLDRIQTLLVKHYQAAEVIRERKPTFAKPAPPALIGRIVRARPSAVIEGLAD